MTTCYVVHMSLKLTRHMHTGSCAHRMGSIVPPVGQRPACAQVYILDGAAQVEARRGLPWGSRLDADILSGLTDMLMAVNPFVQHFRSAAEDDAPELHLRIVFGNCPNCPICNVRLICPAPFPHQVPWNSAMCAK